MHNSSARGFSLVELSIVVAIISVVATLGLEVAANFVARTSTSISRERLKVVDEATAAYFKSFGRLPCPAVINIPPTNANYGLEDCTAVTFFGTIGGGLMWGGVPIRTLNLPSIYALDGFNSKFNYVVTRNLTQAGTAVSGQAGYNAGTPAQNGVGGIEMRSGVLEQPCGVSNKCQILANPSLTPPMGAAYVLFSNGADQRGAYSARGVALKNCVIFSNERRIDTQNCVYGNPVVSGGMIPNNIPTNVFYDSRSNAGLNLSSYFDDVVIWRPRGQL
ncbi:MAG: type II secretion system GspH family protein [Rickettsiales bacterium]|nr:type II secretion system GspH family protein [Rickettsiales bacterium]